jgi:hypothetical protein
MSEPRFPRLKPRKLAARNRSVDSDTPGPSARGAAGRRVREAGGPHWARARGSRAQTLGVAPRGADRSRRYAFPTDVVTFRVSKLRRPGDPTFKRVFDYEPQRDADRIYPGSQPDHRQVEVRVGRPLLTLRTERRANTRATATLYSLSCVLVRQSRRISGKPHALSMLRQ